MYARLYVATLNLIYLTQSFLVYDQIQCQQSTKYSTYIISINDAYFLQRSIFHINEIIELVNN